MSYVSCVFCFFRPVLKDATAGLIIVECKEYLDIVLLIGSNKGQISRSLDELIHEATS